MQTVLFVAHNIHKQFITQLFTANRQYTTVKLDIFSLPLCCSCIRATTQILLNALLWIASIQSEKFFGKGACHAANGYQGLTELQCKQLIRSITDKFALRSWFNKNRHLLAHERMFFISSLNLKLLL